MALHGPIKVNHKIIGYWSAQRIVTADPNVYRCAVTGEPEVGPPLDVTFDIEHRHEDGALALAAKVLARATAVTDGGDTNG